MQLSLSTWNSIAINDGTIYRAWIPEGQLANLSSNPVTVNRAMAFPFLSTTVLNPHVIVIGVTIAAGQNINTYRETLKSYFNIMDTTRHTLVALDAADSNKPYYLTGFPIRIAPEGDSPNSFFITLAVETPVWKLVTALTDNWSITASGQTRAVTNSGNINVAPSFAITPTTTKTGGLTYRRWIPIYNQLDTSWIAPYELTDGLGFDTASLTTAKMQADGDDLLIMMDGSFVDRWLVDMDNAFTGIWINLALSPRREGTTNTTIASSGAITTITFSKTRANLEFLQAVSKAINKVVLIDNEAFTFTAVNLVTYQLTGVTRAQKDTSMAVHTQPSTCRWIEHDVWMLYGDSTLSAPDTNTDNEPVFTYSVSNNRDWRYNTTVWKSTGAAPGAWQGAVGASKTGLSYLFTGDLNTYIDPAVKLGMAMIGPESTYNAQIETATITWSLSHPTGINGLYFYGDKYTTGSWPAVVGLQYLQSNATWFTTYLVVAPTLPNAWESFGIIQTFPPTAKNIRFVMDGSISPTPNEKAMIQFDTLQVKFPLQIPVSAINAEVAINYFDLTITNNTTGEYIKVASPCLVTSGTLTIDCENKKAYLQDGSRVNVTLSTEREAWLDLRAGSNTLQFDDTGTNAVTLVTTHRDGNL